jgi:hypothetical protein
MSVMIAMRQPHEFAIHMGAGLNNDLTLKEIEEVLIQALPRWLSCHRDSAGCCCRCYQGAWSGRRRRLRWPPRLALTLNGIRTAGIEVGQHLVTALPPPLGRKRPNR